jgi:peptide deformylase
MKQPILIVPDPKLREVCAPITALTREVSQAVLDLEDSLRKAPFPGGVGLAFPQIGVLTRGFATLINHRLNIYLNPEITDQSEEMTLGPSKDNPLLEGCLSIPALYGPVWRPKRISFRYIDEKGREHNNSLSNFQARVFLHELDHLDGVLFTDYTKRDNLPLYLYDKDQDSFTQIEDPTAIIKW